MTTTVAKKNRKIVRKEKPKSYDVPAQWYQHQNVQIRSGHFLPLLVLNNPNLEKDLTVQLLRPFLIKPDKFNVRFYLSQKPDIYPTGIQPLLRDSLIEMHLSLNHHPDASQPCKYPFIEKGELSVVNRKSEHCIYKTDLYGFEPELRIKTNLGLEDSKQFYNAIIDIESFLHIQIEFSIRSLVDGSLHTIRSINPIRTVLKDQKLNHEEVMQCFYFDSVLGDYKRLHQPQRKRAFGQKLEENSLYRKGANIKSVNAILRPTATVQSHLLNASLISTAILNSNTFKLNNLVFSGKENNRVKSLPIIDDASKNYWRDRKTSSKIWYKKSYRLVEPQSNTSFNNSPFQFLFKKLGIDSMGNTVLEGTIKITLLTYLDDALKNEIESTGNNLKLYGISTKDASYLLEIPYLNSIGEQKKSQIVADKVEKVGSKVIISFKLINEWIRVAYSMFAMPTDSHKAHIIINYNFDGYTEIKKSELKLSAGFKINAIPLLPSTKRSTSSEDIYFNIKKRSLMMSNGLIIAFKDSKIKKKPMVVVATATTIKPAATFNKPLSIASIPIASNINIIDKIKKDKKYALQAFGRKEELEVEFPCANFGAFFQEENQHGEREAVGCKDPYTLGQVSIPLYTHLSDISNVNYKVYQSTQIPNRFLVEPKRYHISRKAKNGEDAFEPNVILYSTIDAIDLEKSNCVLNMVLEPDITKYDLYQLGKQLKNYSSYEVKMDFITEIESENANFTWTIPQLIAKEVVSFPLGKSIQVTISSKIENIITLKSMLESGSISGKYTLAVSDTSSFESDLLPSLRSVTGPWDEGPLNISKVGNAVFVKNEIESPINISRLVFIKDDIEEIAILNETLAGKSSYEMVRDEDFDSAFAIYEVSASVADLNEIRNYIEDVECQVVLVNNIDFEQHDLESIVVEVKLQKTTAFHSVLLNKLDTAKDFTLLMPITDFLSTSRVVEFRLKDYGEDWYSHHIAQEGNIININSAYILTN